jgi:hypothetical protein
VWIAWGLSVVVWPRWVLRYFGSSRRGHAGLFLRLIGVVVCAIGVAMAVLVLRATPGKLY